MGFGSFFTSAAKWLGNVLKSFWSSNKTAVFEDVEGLALDVVRSVVISTSADRSAAVKEILNAAKSTGQKWGAKLLANGEEEIANSLENHYTTSDLKRYLALARLTVSIIKKFGVQAVPSTQFAFGLIETALLKLDENVGN